MHTWHTKPARYLTRGRPRPPTLVVIHSTEGSTAAGAASWFQNPAAGGSAHVVVDDAEVYRCVDDADTAWHAKGHNSFGLGLEIAGFARWSREQWLAHRPRLAEAARIHAGWCRRYAIPPIRSATSGYHPHAGLAGNDHWDPGPGFPWDVYLAQLNRYLGIRPDRAALPYGRSLRIIRGAPGEERHARWGGWSADEVPAGWDGPALGPLRALARSGPLRIPFVLTWRGGRWEDPVAIPKVARSILARYAKEA